MLLHSHSLPSSSASRTCLATRLCLTTPRPCPSPPRPQSGCNNASSFSNEIFPDESLEPPTPLNGLQTRRMARQGDADEAGASASFHVGGGSGATEPLACALSGNCESFPSLSTAHTGHVVEPGRKHHRAQRY